jgi:hypothetical protein
LLATAVVAVAFALPGCGSDDEGPGIPKAQARALQQQLDSIQARIDNGSVGACQDITGGSNGPNNTQVAQIIDSLPDDTDPDVVDALQESFDHLFDLTDEQCASLEDERTTPTETEPETTPTETETTTTETETAPPPETETTAPPETETVPPAETTPPDQTGNGNANGGGNGNGGGAGAPPEDGG